MLHAVPSALARHKDLVAIYQGWWNQYVSPGEALFAHRGQGEELVEQMLERGHVPRGAKQGSVPAQDDQAIDPMAHSLPRKSQGVGYPGGRSLFHKDLNLALRKPGNDFLGQDNGVGFVGLNDDSEAIEIFHDPIEKRIQRFPAILSNP